MEDTLMEQLGLARQRIADLEQRQVGSPYIKRLEDEIEQLKGDNKRLLEMVADADHVYIPYRSLSKQKEE